MAVSCAGVIVTRDGGQTWAGCNRGMLNDYDLAVIRLAAGDRARAWKALQRALTLNPKLAAQAERDPDLEKLRPFPRR